MLGFEHAQSPRSVRANMWARNGTDRGPASIVLSASKHDAEGLAVVVRRHRTAARRSRRRLVARTRPCLVATRRRSCARQVEPFDEPRWRVGSDPRPPTPSSTSSREIGSVASSCLRCAGVTKNDARVDAEELLEVLEPAGVVRERSAGRDASQLWRRRARARAGRAGCERSSRPRSLGATVEVELVDHEGEHVGSSSASHRRVASNSGSSMSRISIALSIE